MGISITRYVGQFRYSSANERDRREVCSLARSVTRCKMKQSKRKDRNLVADVVLHSRMKCETDLPKQRYGTTPQEIKYDATVNPNTGHQRSLCRRTFLPKRLKKMRKEILMAHNVEM